jgi:hypothetical protein
MPNEKSKWRNPRMWPLWAKVALACGLIIGGLLAVPPDWLQTYQPAGGTTGTTVVFEALAYDGAIRNQGTDYNTCWSATSGSYSYNTTTTIMIGQRYIIGQYYIARAFIYFDTSSLPDGASIQEVILSVNVTTDGSTTDFNLTVYKPETYARPDMPMDLDDYYYAYYDTAEELGRLSSIGITTNVYTNITLTAWVNVTGTTKLILRTDREFSQTTPSGNEYFNIAAQESGFPAKLYVTYTVGKTIWVYRFDGTEQTNWYAVGNAPYLNNYTSSYIYSVGIGNMSWFHFEDTSETSFSQAFLHLEWKTLATTDVKRLKLYLHNGTVEQAWGEYYLTSSWTWKAVNVTAFLNTITEINNAKVKFESLTDGIYDVLIRRCYLQIYNATDPLPDNIYHGPLNMVDKQLDTSFVAGTSCTFKVKWQTDYFQDKLSHYVFSWNASGIWQNDTAKPFSGSPTVAWSNVTKTLPSANQTVLWRIYVNMSGNLWSSTPAYPLWIVSTTEISFSENVGFTTLNGFNAFRYDGAVSAIYVPFTNSTTGKYMITAYDLTNDVWISPVEIGDAPTSDPHWKPSIGAFPNGSLVIFWGYYEPIKYRVTSLSADAEGNLTALLNSFSSQVYNLSEPISSSYPVPFTFKGQSLIVFYRDTEKDWWMYRKFNGTAWESQQYIIRRDETTYRFYPFYYKQNNTLLMGWFRKEGSGADKQDVGLIFTDDQAVTWKLWNGTVFTPPINDTVICIDTTSLWGGTSVVLDAQNKPVVLITKPWWDPPLTMRVAVYNTTLGTSGIWTVYDVKNEFNETLTGRWTHLFLSENRIAFYLSPTENFPDILDFHEFNITKYVMTNVPYRFQPLSKTNLNGEMGATRITDSTEVYEITGIFRKAGILGLHEKGASILDGNGLIWGTKFVAQEDASIAGVRVWSEDTAESGQNHHVAIYNSTFHLLAKSSSAQDVGKTGVWSITLSFNTTVRIQAGQKYWLVIEMKTTGDRIRYKPSSELVNQTFYYNGTLASQITPDGYYNYTLCIHAVQTELLVLGKTSPPVATNVNATNNIAGQNCTFHAYWTSERPLDTATFYWNASGTMQPNGTIALAGTEAWSNFTRTLPKGTVTIAWYIEAVNVDGITASTGEQYLTVEVVTELVVGWNIIDEADVGGVDVGHTLLEIYWSLGNDSITVTTISKYNGTYYTFKPGYHWNENVKILAETDRIYIYVTTAGTWYHKYN